MTDPINPQVPTPPAPPSAPVAPVQPASAPVAPVSPTPPSEDNLVHLSADAYNALLDRLDELEMRNIPASQQTPPSNVDDLAQRGQRRDQAITPETINNMTPMQIVDFVIGHMNETAVKPLLTKIEEMNVKTEINEIMADPKNADFVDLKEDIYKIAVENPTLSLKQALILARERKGASPTPPSPSNRGDLLRNLPPRRVISGEKPNAAVVSTSEAVPETRMDAAKQALDEMLKAGKIKL
jgi:hypothetical protein